MLHTGIVEVDASLGRELLPRRKGLETEGGDELVGGRRRVRPVLPLAHEPLTRTWGVEELDGEVGGALDQTGLRWEWSSQCWLPA